MRWNLHLSENRWWCHGNFSSWSTRCTWSEHLLETMNSYFISAARHGQCKVSDSNANVLPWKKMSEAGFWPRLNWMSSWHIISVWITEGMLDRPWTPSTSLEQWGPENQLRISGLITERGEIRVLKADRVLRSAFGIALEAQKDHHESSKRIDARLERARRERVAVMSGRFNIALVEERARLRSVAVISIGLKVNRETSEQLGHIFTPVPMTREKRSNYVIIQVAEENVMQWFFFWILKSNILTTFLLNKNRFVYSFWMLAASILRFPNWIAFECVCKTLESNHQSLSYVLSLICQSMPHFLSKSVDIMVQPCDGSFDSWLLWLLPPCPPSPCLLPTSFLYLCFSLLANCRPIHTSTCSLFVVQLYSLKESWDECQIYQFHWSYGNMNQMNYINMIYLPSKSVYTPEV